MTDIVEVSCVNTCDWSHYVDMDAVDASMVELKEKYCDEDCGWTLIYNSDVEVSGDDEIVKSL